MGLWSGGDGFKLNTVGTWPGVVMLKSVSLCSMCVSFMLMVFGLMSVGLYAIDFTMLVGRVCGCTIIDGWWMCDY